MNLLAEDIINLYKQDLTFAVFNMNFSTKKPVLHAGIFQCCGSKAIVSEEVRIIFEKKIIDNTEFTKIIWEI
jgi:hypothetical protein